MNESIKDTYQVLAAAAEGEYKEKGSKFLAYAYPISSLEDFEYYLEEVRSIHPKARHFCYAYRIGIDVIETCKDNACAIVADSRRISNQSYGGDCR